METIQKEITMLDLFDDYLDPIKLHIEKANKLCNVLYKHYLQKSTDFCKDEFQKTILSTEYAEIQTLAEIIHDNIINAQELMEKVHQIDLANEKVCG